MSAHVARKRIIRSLAFAFGLARVWNRPVAVAGDAEAINARRHLELDLSDPAIFRFGMFSAAQDETAAIELSEEPPASSGQPDLSA